MDQKVKELQKECAKWEEKYNTLLEKNQNDLIKIRMREKQLNETIGKLEEENAKLKVSYEKKILDLNEEIQRLKQNSSSKNLPVESQPNAKRNDENDLNDRISKLQSQNIELKAEIRKAKGQSSQKQQLSKKITKIQLQVTQQKKQNVQLKAKNQEVTRNSSLKISQMKVKEDSMFSEIEKLRQLVKITDVQYKNLIHKEQQQDELLKSKNQELNLMTEELIGLQKRVQQLRNNEEALKSKYSEDERKKDELEQENSLLKQMIKGQKTMIKIKDNQIARLKEK